MLHDSWARFRSSLPLSPLLSHHFFSRIPLNFLALPRQLSLIPTQQFANDVLSFLKWCQKEKWNCVRNTKRRYSSFIQVVRKRWTGWLTFKIKETHLSEHDTHIYIYIETFIVVCLLVAVVQSLSCVWLFVTPSTEPRSGFPVLHHLLESAQTHAHWVGDTIQQSHPLLSPNFPAFNLSQHQSLFQWNDSLHQVAKILELQHQSFQWIFRIDFL